VRCRDGTLYTGIATDVSRRLKLHQQGEGKGAKYLRGRSPLELVFEKLIGDRGLALRVGGLIKKLPKSCKEELVKCHDMADAIVAEAMRRSDPR
jgi:putative endonuclease